jgi:hypothetical protein
LQENGASCAFVFWELLQMQKDAVDVRINGHKIPSFGAPSAYGFHVLLIGFTVKRVKGSREFATELYHKPENPLTSRKSHFNKNRNFLEQMSEQSEALKKAPAPLIDWIGL